MFPMMPMLIGAGIGALTSKNKLKGGLLGAGLGAAGGYFGGMGGGMDGILSSQGGILSTASQYKPLFDAASTGMQMANQPEDQVPIAPPPIQKQLMGGFPNIAQLQSKQMSDDEYLREKRRLLRRGILG